MRYNLEAKRPAEAKTTVNLVTNTDHLKQLQAKLLDARGCGVWNGWMTVALESPLK